MKKFLLFLLLSIPHLLTYSQEAVEKPCGTTITPEQATNLRNLLAPYQHLEENFREHFHSRGGALPSTQVPIKAHIVRTSAATGGLTLTQLNNAISNMNNYYENAFIEFFLCEAVNYINDDTYYNFNAADENVLCGANDVANAINIYFFNSVTSGTSALCGYAYFPGSTDRIIMDNGCAINGSTLPHEVGHYFSLYHTHGTTNTGTTDELVDGSNCNTAGDDICDTEADPNLSGVVNTSCNYTGTALDGNGQSFNPNTHNIMSYSRKNCRDYFSPGQYARIYVTHLSARSYLACSDLSADFTASPTSTCGTSLTVNFTYTGLNATSWNWDVDGDGTIDYTTQNPSHTYSSSGNYDVVLEVSDGSNSRVRIYPAMINVGSSQGIPFVENFESFVVTPYNAGVVNGWSTNPDNTSSQFRWKSNASTTPSANTGPAVDQTTGTANGKYMYTEASQGSNGSIAYLYSPCIELNASAPMLEFYYHMYGGSTGTLHVDMLSGGSWVNDVITPISGQQQSSQNDPYVLVQQSLLAYAAETVQFRFRAVRGNGFAGDIAIDDFRVFNNTSDPEVSFVTTSATYTESSGATVDCRGYTDYNFPLQIANIPSGDATINFIASGSADEAHDFSILTPTVVFPDGDNSNKELSIRVYDDQTVETDETISIIFSITGSTNAIPASGNTTLLITIQDNDKELNEYTGNTITLDEDFEDGTADGWSLSQAASSTGWEIGTTSALSSTFMAVPARSGLIAGSNDDACNCDMSIDYFITPELNLTSAVGASLDLDYFLAGNYGSTGSLLVSTAGATGPWTLIQNFTADLSNWQSMNIDLSAYVGGSIWLNFHHNDNGAWADGFMIDNVIVSTAGLIDLPIAATVGLSSTAYLGPASKVHFLDPGNNDVIATIDNTGSWNFGCTTVSIDRSGTGVSPYDNSDPTYYMMDKTLLINPANNSTSAAYDIYVYFDNSAISNWESATGNSTAELNLVKTGGPVSNITPASPDANGPTNYTGASPSLASYTGSGSILGATFYTGFSGVGAGNPAGSPLPVELVTFTGQPVTPSANLLEWETASEINASYFELQRSQDAVNFNFINKIDARGTSNQGQLYYHYDEAPIRGPVNYYRLKMVDNDASFEYSSTIAIQNEIESDFELFVSPNPFEDVLIIKSFSTYSGAADLILYDINGRIAWAALLEFENGASEVQVSVNAQLSPGIYHLKLFGEKGFNAATRLIKF